MNQQISARPLPIRIVNHNQTVMVRPLPGVGLTVNHNQTVMVRPLPGVGLTVNHNQTVVIAPTVRPQHNQTVIRR